MATLDAEHELKNLFKFDISVQRAGNSLLSHIFLSVITRRQYELEKKSYPEHLVAMGDHFRIKIIIRMRSRAKTSPRQGPNNYS